MLGGETVLAVMLCKMLKEDADYVWKAVAVNCESLGIYHEALLALNQLAEPGNLITELGVRYPGPAHEVSDFYLKVYIFLRNKIKEIQKEMIYIHDTTHNTQQHAQHTQHAQAGLSTVPEFVELAEAEAAKGNTAAAVLNYAAARQSSSAGRLLACSCANLILFCAMLFVVVRLTV